MFFNVYVFFNNLLSVDNQLQKYIFFFNCGKYFLPEIVNVKKILQLRMKKINSPAFLGVKIE